MDVVVERCAGLDVHPDSVVTTVRPPGTGRRRREQKTHSFATTIGQLELLTDWLLQSLHRARALGWTESALRVAVPAFCDTSPGSVGPAMAGF